MSHYSFKLQHVSWLLLGFFFFFFHLSKLPEMEKLAPCEFGQCHTPGKTPQLLKLSIQGFRNNKSTAKPQHQSRRGGTNGEVAAFSRVCKAHKVTSLLSDGHARVCSSLWPSSHIAPDNRAAFVSILRDMTRAKPQKKGGRKKKKKSLFTHMEKCSWVDAAV